MTETPSTYLAPKLALSRALLRPKKSFGQNFLLAEDVLRDIARAATEGLPGATVVELGAGTGALTHALLERGVRVVAVERDRDLVPLLGAQFEHEIASGRVQLVEGDAQELDTVSLAGPGARVLTGNLPYQITGSLVEKAVREAKAWSRAVFMVQLEVADRMAAAADTEDYGALSVFVQAAFAVTRLRVVPPACFLPPPNVTSAVVVLRPHAVPRAVETQTFRTLVKLAFGQRRKTLRNAWKNAAEGPLVAEAAEAARIALTARGETLTVEDFARMASELSARTQVKE